MGRDAVAAAAFERSLAREAVLHIRTEMTFDASRARLGQRLLELRHHSELTQVEVAARAKLTRQQLQRLDR